MADFRIDYDKVISQANTICSLADELSRQIRKLEDLRTVMNNGWEGPASSVFRQKLNSLIAEMESTYSSMNSVASTIKTTAKRIKREDERLAREAQILA